MSNPLKDRHLFGVGAAASAVCCAAPVLTLLGVAGVAATVVTFDFAVVVFGLVVAGAALFTVRIQRRRRRSERRFPAAPFAVEISTTRPGPDV